MSLIVIILQILIAVSLIGVITIQSKSGGLARQIGSPGSFTRRGLEKLIFKLTFVLTFVFILISTLQLVV